MRFFAVCLCVLLSSTAAQSAPRDYAFTWSTNAQAPRTTQLETWLTPRVNRVSPNFFLLESRVALSLGISETFDAQFALEADFQGDKKADTTVNPAANILLRFVPIHNTNILSAGLMASLKVSEQYFQLTARGLVDKAIGRMLFSLNISVAQTLFFKGSKTANAFVEGQLATRFQINSELRAGLEFQSRSAFAKNYLGTGFYVGPTVSVDYKTWYFSLGALAQVSADKAESERGNGEPLALNENERFWFRVVIGLKP
jgi:hypothetical protein